MKALVTYYSETGNTEKLAKAIFDAIDQPGKEIKPISEVSAVDNYDVIFCGLGDGNDVVGAAGCGDDLVVVIAAAFGGHELRVKQER